MNHLGFLVQSCCPVRFYSCWIGMWLFLLSGVIYYLCSAAERILGNKHKMHCCSLFLLIIFLVYVLWGFQCSIRFALISPSCFVSILGFDLALQRQCIYISSYIFMSVNIVASSDAESLETVRMHSCSALHVPYSVAECALRHLCSDLWLYSQFWLPRKHSTSLLMYW